MKKRNHIARVVTQIAPKVIGDKRRKLLAKAEQRDA